MPHDDQPLAPTSYSYVTTSIPYVNGAPHVGHAFEDVQADLYARRRRQIGVDTRLQTGSDDNSLKNVLAAEREGLPTTVLVERNAALFEALAATLDVSYDGFIRTGVDPAHRRGVEMFWRACLNAGAIYKRRYQGLYCVGCETFYSPDDLTPEGLCAEHLVAPETIEEDNYFFRLSRYAEPLHDLIATGALRIVPETRRNEALAFIARGLQDFSISRSAARARGWGIAVPGDPTQVVYVWFDALVNYITALGYGDPSSDLCERYWLNANERVHVIGKGILHFHAVYWPAMLLAAGEPLPTTVVVHGYLTVEGRKIGKSLGNAIDPLDLIARYGVDALRWYVLRDLHPFADGDVSVTRLVARYNTDLANGLGNLLNRANAMLHRYRDGVVPAPRDLNDIPGIPAALDALSALALKAPAHVAAAFEAFDPRAALDAVWGFIDAGNALVDEAAPWSLHRQAREGDAGAGELLDDVLYALLETVRLIAVYLEPFLPAAVRRIATQLGAAAPHAALPYDERVRWGGLVPGARTAAPAPVFPRLDEAALGRGPGGSALTGDERPSARGGDGG